MLSHRWSALGPAFVPWPLGPGVREHPSQQNRAGRVHTPGGGHRRTPPNPWAGLPEDRGRTPGPDPCVQVGCEAGGDSRDGGGTLEAVREQWGPGAGELGEQGCGQRCPSLCLMLSSAVSPGPEVSLTGDQGPCSPPHRRGLPRLGHRGAPQAGWPPCSGGGAGIGGGQVVGAPQVPPGPTE